MTMPVAVVLASSALSLTIAARAALLIVAMAEVPAEAPIIQGALQLGIGSLILCGFLWRQRLAWQWGRVATALGFVLLAVMLFALGRAPSVRWTSVPFLLTVLQAAPLPVIFFALGTESACDWFRLRCATCQRLSSVSADFLFTRARCLWCRTTW